MLFHCDSVRRLWGCEILRWVGFASGSSWSERSDASQRRLFLRKLRHLALFGTTWHYLATLGHEMPRIFSTFVRTWSTCIILHHMVPILCHTAFSSLSMSFLIFLRIYAFASCFLLFFFSLECNGSRWFCCKLPYFSVCSPTFGPCCWAPPFAESPMPCCRLKDQWKTKFHQVTESYPKGQGRDRESRYQGRNTVTECNWVGESDTWCRTLWWCNKSTAKWEL